LQATIEEVLAEVLANFKALGIAGIVRNVF